MIFVDVETTGLESSDCSIVSIGGVELENPSNRFYIECKPWAGAVIEEKALMVNGFTREYLSGITNSIGVAIKAFDDWAATACKDGIMGGHNVNFDHSFLATSYLKFLKRPPSVYSELEDLMEVFTQSRYFTGYGRSLNKVLESLGLKREPDPHHALRGAMLEAEAYSRIKKGSGIFSQSELYGPI